MEPQNPLQPEPNSNPNPQPPGITVNQSQPTGSTNSPQPEAPINNQYESSTVSPLAVGSATTQAYTQTQTNEGSKSYLVAFLLSLLLGGIGVDRFYLGYKGTGLLKLLTFGGFGIWYLIDLIMIFTNHKKAKNGTSLKGYTENKKVATIIFIIIFLINLALMLYYFFVVASFFKALDKGVSITTNSDGSTTTIIGTEDKQKTDNSTVTSLGSTASAEKFTVKVTKVVPNPETTGDKPDTGTQYLQIDLSITNTGSESSFVPGSFFYHTSSGDELLEAHVFGNQGSANKNVELVGRESMTAVTVDNGKTDNTRSLIFQIPQGDKGQLVWRDGIFDKKGAKFATFALY